MLRTGSLLAALMLVTAVAALPDRCDAQLFRVGELTLVHGLPGDELDDPDLMIDIAPNLPVDILIGVPGSLNVFFTNVQFGEVRGPLTLSQGVYQVEFRSADEMNPGTGPLIASTNVAVRPRENHSVVLHVTPNRTPRATDYLNDDNGIGLLNSRVVFRHNAQVGPVDMGITSALGQPGAVAVNISNGQQSASFNVRTGPYVRFVHPAAQQTNLLPPQNVFLYPKNFNVYYLVGSVERGTLTIITQSYRPRLLP